MATTKTAASFSIRSDWAEEADKDESGLPRAYETVPNKDGIKEIVTFKRNESGQVVMTTRKIKVEKKVTAIPKGVAERKNWAKFGDCRNAGPGPEENVTIIGEEVSLEFPSKQGKRDEQPEETAAAGGSKGVVCRNCGAKGLHLTQNCPYKGLKIPNKDVLRPEGETAGSGSPVPENTSGKYVPPNRRSGGAESSSMDRRDKDNCSLRVSNLSEDVSEMAVRDLFSRYGHVQRVYLAKDWHTQQRKGFGFVTFTNRVDAAKAKEALNGYGLDHLVLSVEWARSSNQ